MVPVALWTWVISYEHFGYRLQVVIMSLMGFSLVMLWSKKKETVVAAWFSHLIVCNCLIAFLHQISVDLPSFSIRLNKERAVSLDFNASWKGNVIFWSSREGKRMEMAQMGKGLNLMLIGPQLLLFTSIPTRRYHKGCWMLGKLLCFWRNLVWALEKDDWHEKNSCFECWFCSKFSSGHLFHL